MYRPSYSINDDPKMALRLIQDFPLGLLISHQAGAVEANYLPFIARWVEGQLVLITHLARSNPQWQRLGPDVLVSFQGPNRYISPTMYSGKNNVPTWNYAAVQAKGQVELITAPSDLKALLHESVGEFEFRNGSDWKYDLPSPLQERLESAIIGLRIKATVFAKFKLSQNRSDEDFESVLSYLETSEKPSDGELLKWMRKNGSEL